MIKLFENYLTIEEYKIVNELFDKVKYFLRDIGEEVIIRGRFQGNILYIEKYYPDSSQENFHFEIKNVSMENNWNHEGRIISTHSTDKYKKIKEFICSKLSFIYNEEFGAYRIFYIKSENIKDIKEVIINKEEYEIFLSKEKFGL